MNLQQLQAQLNVAQLQLVALNASYQANLAQIEYQNTQNVARITNQISSLESQIASLQSSTGATGATGATT